MKGERCYCLTWLTPSAKYNSIFNGYALYPWHIFILRTLDQTKPQWCVLILAFFLSDLEKLKKPSHKKLFFLFPNKRREESTGVSTAELKMATNERSPPRGTRLYPGRCWQRCRVAHKCTADKCKFTRLLGSQPIQGGNLAFYWKHTVHIPQSPGISLRKDRKKDQSPWRDVVLKQFCGLTKQGSNPTFWRHNQLCRLNESGCLPLTGLFQILFMT